jgi:cytochrome P450
VNAVGDMQRLTMAVIARALLSTDVASDEAARFGQAVRDSQRLVRQRNTSWLALPSWVPTPANRHLRATRATLDAYIDLHLRARREGRGGCPFDILRALLQARDPETGEALPHDALRDETKTLFVAGFETTATALAWTLYLLARHPEAASRWHDEVDQTLDGAPPAYEDLERLTWTGQVIHEALRLYPPVYNIARECITDDEIDGHPITAGSTALISVFGIHRAADWWPNPHTFDPERFAPGREWPRHAFLPFAVGKHICIGASFALTEMTVILALLAQRFRIALADDREVGEVPQITLAPEREIPLRLTPRSA